jgi:Golgi phosphoprotein 3 (GPP34)
MTTLIAEDLLLITAHPTRATLHLPRGIALPRALAGAVLRDSLDCGAARLDDGRLLSTGAAHSAGPVVEHVLGRLWPRQPHLDRVIDLLASPRTRLGQHLLRSLTAGGAAVLEQRHVFGVIPRRSYTAADPATAEALRARVMAALLGSVDDPRVTTLAHLIAAGDLYRTVHLDLGGHQQRRLRPFVVDDPIATAVRDTIRRARRDAATAGAVAATAGAVASSGN